MLKLATFALSLWLCVNTYARLGETTNQMIDRWGPPRSTTDDIVFSEGRSYVIGSILRFTSDDWTISAHVIEGRCAKIVYSKLGSWTDDQKTVVLTSNSQNAKWSKSIKPVAQEWNRTDGATAKLILDQFQIEHPAYKRAVDKGKAAAKSDSARKPKI